MPLLSSPDHQTLTYLNHAWHLIKRDPLLVGWKIVGDLMVLALQVTGVLGVLSVLVYVGQKGLAPQIFSRPGFWITLAFGSSVVWMLEIAMRSLIFSGLWGTMAQAVHTEEVRSRKPFGQTMTKYFTTVLMHQGVASLRSWSLAGLTVSACFGMVRITPNVIAADNGFWLGSLMWSVMLTLLAVLTLVTRVVVDFSAVSLLLKGSTLSGALVDGARVAATRLGQVYRIFIYVAAILLVPLVLDLFVQSCQNMAYGNAFWETILLPLRLCLELLVLLVFAFAFVLFYGAIFAFYAEQFLGQSLMLNGLALKHTKDDAIGSATLRPASPAVDDLLPVRFPNIFDLKAVLSKGPSNRPTSSTDRQIDEMDDDQND
jgi:hypothetical protein